MIFYLYFEFALGLGLRLGLMFGLLFGFLQRSDCMLLEYASPIWSGQPAYLD